MKSLKVMLVFMLTLCMMLGSVTSFAYTGAENEEAGSAPEKGTVNEEAADAEDALTGRDGETDKEEPDIKEDENSPPPGEEKPESSRNADMTEDSAPEDPKEEISFTADRSDCLSYDPLYIAKYANRKYINTDAVSMDRYVNVVTAAKGIATYNIAKQSDFEVTEKNYIAGMNYEMPVYNIDDESDFYIAIPNVNLFNGHFKAYDLITAYNNDNGETIKGWKYEKGILYIPKSAVDSPKNDVKVPEKAVVAVQLNYAIGRDMDFSKTIPVQILKGRKPQNSTVKADNIFDVDCLSVDTGVKGRKASDISVFLNGHLIPVNPGAWSYDRSSGKIDIQAMPGVVSNINIVFAKQTVKEKTKSIAAAAASLISDEAYAVTTEGMSVLRNDAGQEVTLNFDTSLMFTGWRGHYSTKVIHKHSVSNFNGLSGWRSSVSYLYGGYTSKTGSWMESASDKEIDAALVPLWAIQSYAVGADVGLATNTGNIQKDTQVKHYVTSGSTETHTMYEWLMANRNNLEKSKEVYADGQGNSIGGANNFAAHWPIGTVTGSGKSLTPSGQSNPSITFSSDQISASQWFAASCSELDDAASSESDDDVYVTCLDITDEYVVLAFAQARGGQNMCAIYKFRVKPRGYACIHKKNASEANDYLSEAPNNYDLKGARYQLFTDAACSNRAKDVNGYDFELVTDEKGKTGIVAMDPGRYYAREVAASRGFELEKPSDGGYPGTDVYVTNKKDNPAVITSKEPPATGVPLLKVFKIDPSGRYAWSKLRGAEYRITYFDVTSKEAIDAADPVRSWSFRTRKIEGDSVAGTFYAGFDWTKDEPLEGSDAFYIENGARVIPCGWFTIQEISAPSGLALDDTLHYGRVYQPSNGSAAATDVEGANKKGDIEIDVVVKDAPQAVKLVIDKRNASTGENKARESEADHSSTRLGRFSTLAGAEYEVYFDDDDLAAPELIGKIVTDEKGHGELTERTLGDSRFIGDSLPVGSYIIKEVKASPGFVTDNYYLSENTQKIRQDEEIEVICGYDENGDAVRKKISGKYSDGGHCFRTRAETANTGVFNYTVSSDEHPTKTYIKKTDAATGKELEGAALQIISDNDEDRGLIVEQWVSTDKEHLVWELPEGKYILREITAPYGYDIAEDVSFEIKEGVIIHKAEMKNKPVTIQTSASDAVTDTHHGVASDEQYVKDKVKISGLYEDRSYMVRGRLIDKKTGETLKDKDGNEVGCEREFVAAGDKAEVEMVFVVDSRMLEGENAAVGFERLYRTSAVHEKNDNDTAAEGNGTDELPVEIAKHEDADFEGQTIHYGGILRTTALDKKGKSHNVTAGTKTVVRDIVEYRNLSPEETYKIEGELYDKTSGKLTGITSSVEFRPEAADGKVEVVFSFDAGAYRDHTFVVFETLTLNGRLIDEHKDPEDRDQTVFIKPRKSPQTGDNAVLYLYAISLLLSLIAILVMRRCRM